MAAISWSTIGKSDPLVRGEPSEFDGVASAFDNIRERTSLLSDELLELRAGEAEGFRGEAAMAFSNRIKSLSGALADVPIVASSIAGVFRSHSRDLSALRREAGAALARAETGWNKKRHAESDISSCESRLRSISRQLSALSGDDSPGAASARSRLQSRRSSVSHERGQAQRRLDDANDRLDRSRSEWESLRKDEDTLNEQTSKALLNLELHSLGDPSLLESLRDKVVGVFVDIAEGIAAVWESIEAEFLATIHQILSDLLDVLDWAGLVLDFIPGVNLVYKAVEFTVVAAKAAVGLGLVAKGAMSMAEWAGETALDAVGLIPGVPKALIKPLAKVGSKIAGPVAKKISDGVSAGARKLKIDTDRVADVVGNTASTASKKIGSMRQNLSKRVTGIFERRSLDIYHLRMKQSWRRYQRKTPGSGYERHFSDFDRRRRDLDRSAIGGSRRVPFESEHYAAAIAADRVANSDRVTILKMGQKYGSYITKDGVQVSWDMATLPWPLNADEAVVEYVRERTEPRPALGERSVPVKDGRQPVLEPCGL